ncbi:hypothetical protein DXF93_24775 [Escherichia coli]|nr:hypothetical protein DXF93_24775 [Escherichia coli]
MIWCSVNRALRMAISSVRHNQYVGRSLKVNGPVYGDAYSLNSTGSWNAMMWDSGNKVGHWVVVKGTDDLGNVIINDPFKGTRYTMTIDEFKDTWNGYSDYKP